MDITDVRAQNVKLILNTLRFSKGNTKKEIARQTGLSFSTVSIICNSLTEKGILEDVRSRAISVGRTPNQLSIAHQNFYVICLDLVSKNLLRICAINFLNQVLFRSCHSISGCETIADVVQSSYDISLKLCQEKHLSEVGCVSVGVAVDGVFDNKSGVLIYSTVPEWELAPLQELIETTFHRPCCINSKSNYCTLAIQQKNPGSSNFMYLNLDQELTAGIMSNNQLVQGQNNHAPRIGHLPIGNPNKLCRNPACRNHGCISTEIALAGMVDGYGESLSLTLQERWRMLVEKIRSKPERFSDYLAEKGQYMGRLISALVCTLDPAIVYLGGDCVEIFDLLRPAIMDEVEKHCPLACSFGLEVIWDNDNSSTLNIGIAQMIYSNWNPLDLA